MKITAFIPAALMIFGLGCGVWLDDGVWFGGFGSTGNASDSTSRFGQEEAEQTETQTSPAREEVERTEKRDRHRRGDINRPGRKEADQASRENRPPRRKEADQASRENPPPRRKVVDKAGQGKADQGENSDLPIQKELDRLKKSRGK